MGEAKRRQLQAQSQALEAMVVDKTGGRIHFQWDCTASATPNAQLSFFAEFLKGKGVYESWISRYPLTYSSPNPPDKRDVLGTWLLAILAGYKRYAHITGLRKDAVSPQILGMNKIISEDALRRALSRMGTEQSNTWLVPQLLAGVGRAVKHAGQITLYLPPMHAATGKLMALITNIRAALSQVRAVADQLPNTDRWRTFLDYVVAKITRPLPPWLSSKQLEVQV